jgi:2'-5' RNA ligase
VKRTTRFSEKPELPQVLEHIGATVRVCGQHERAARLWGAAEALRQTLAVPRPPNEADDYHHHVTAARRASGEEAFAAAWAEGRAMGPVRAIAYGLEHDE